RTPEAATFLLETLSRGLPAGSDLTRFAYHISRFGTDAEVIQLDSHLEGQRESDLDTQFSLLESLAHGLKSGGKDFPQSVTDWALTVAGGNIESENEGIATRGLDLVKDFRLASLVPRVEAMATG